MFIIQGSGWPSILAAQSLVGQCAIDRWASCEYQPATPRKKKRYEQLDCETELPCDLITQPSRNPLRHPGKKFMTVWVGQVRHRVVLAGTSHNLLTHSLVSTHREPRFASVLHFLCVLPTPNCIHTSSTRIIVVVPRLTLGKQSVVKIAPLDPAWHETSRFCGAADDRHLIRFLCQRFLAGVVARAGEGKCGLWWAYPRV